MKTNKLIFLAATTFTIVGCSSSNKLPMPEGERTPLNQNGIPVELALAMAKENQKMIVPAKPPLQVKSVPVNKPLPVVTGAKTNVSTQFSHAKNNAVSAAIASNKKTVSGNSVISPFAVDRAGKTNSILSDKVKAPIVTSPPLVTTKSQPVTKVAISKPVLDSQAMPKVSLTPIKVNVDNGKLWVAVPGSTLRSTLIKWSSDDKCNSSDSWNVIWPVDIDYPMDSRLEFRGNFYEAITRLFDLYKKAQQPLYIDIYKSQCILSVSSAANSK